jgi:hypothetical protein
LNFGDRTFVAKRATVGASAITFVLSEYGNCDQNDEYKPDKALHINL